MMLIVPYDSHEGGEERGLGEEEGQGHRGLVPVQGVGQNVAMHLINVLCGRTPDTYFVARISQPIRGQVSVTNCKMGPALSLLIAISPILLLMAL